jgi:hypothetical protein
MTTCYQKYAKSGSDLWAYNRYTNFNIADTASSFPYDSARAAFQDFTIRARPVSGTNSNFYALRDWAPREGEVNCSNPGSVTVGTQSFNISIPIDQCTSTDTLVSEGGNAFHFGRDFDGLAPEEQGAMTLDAAIAFQAANTTVVPSFADYDWVEIDFCQIHIAGQACGSNDYYQWDSGW